MVTEAIWIVGVGLLTCASHVHFRDTRPIVETAMMVGFYATPVVYTAELAPDWARTMIALNPMAEIISSFRAVLLDDEVPDVWSLTWPLVLGIVVLAVGATIYQSASGKFLDEL